MNLHMNDVKDTYQNQNQFYYNNLLLNVSSNEMEELYNQDTKPNDYHTEKEQSKMFLNISSSPEIMDGKFKERNVKHFVTTASLNEPDFLALDTSNSNCRDTFFMPNLDQKLSFTTSNYLVNEHDSGKKFISELHINIKDPQMNEGDKVFTRSGNNEVNCTNYTTVHSCNLKTYEGDQDDQNDYDQRDSYSSENVPSSLECPIIKKGCHLSEKFIYLGGDPRLTVTSDNFKYELQSYHSPVEMLDEIQRNSSIRSDEFMDNEVSKSFSSKSVQTSKKLDCIFKKTIDKCIETDVMAVAFKIENEGENDIVTKGVINPRDKTTSSSCSNNASLEYSASHNDKKHRYKPNYRQDYEPKYATNCKPSKDHTRHASKNRKPPQQPDFNQDTDIESYSESFNKSNVSYSTEKEDIKQCKFVQNNQSIRRPEVVKTNKSGLNNKLNVKAKNHKHCERKDTNKSSDVLKNYATKDGKANVNSKVTGEHHSYEIQCLLDNLNIHLQNTVNSHKSKIGPSKSSLNQFNNTSSFWDNPLNPETSRSFFLNKQSTSKNTDVSRHKILNPEIQALFETLEKPNHKPEKSENVNIRPRKSPKLDVTTRNIKTSNGSVNEIQSNKKCGDVNDSIDNFNDVRFPTNLKFQKSFELSPYDELVKSHLNSADRRIKSVAAKNGCQIVIDGPINLTDPTSTCQAIRNKIAYRCTIAGSSKDRLDKCLNYLKETFPNTCLRLHSRTNITVKS